MNFTRVGRTARSVNGLKTCYRKLSAGANQNGNPASGKVDMVGIAFFGAISAATLGLGLWQTKR